jgi:predicted permease
VDTNPSVTFSAILAQIVCFLNAVGGYLIARYAFRKPFEKFVSIVLGSMFVRIMAVGLISWVALTMYNVESLSYSLSLAFGVFIYLFIEVFYFHALADKRKKHDA